MRVSRMLALAATLSLAITPAVAASVNPAAGLSLTAAQDGTVKEDTSAYLLIGAGVVAVIIAAIALSGNDDSTPASA